MDIKNGYPLPVGTSIFDTRMFNGAGTGIIVSVSMDTRTR